ncbi:MAG: Gfo/Idh/MocA family oxidoreductase [Nitrospirae bacterium]|nr:Gfo/Idh/MocA family oxidoreductase [Nitrospirota bacterium]
MRQTIRTAIIGCGDIAGRNDEQKKTNGIFTHAGAYRAFPEIEIAAAFDVNRARLDEFCDYWKVAKGVSSLEELLRDRYDIISVCTGDDSHHEVMEKILEAGSAGYIWAEKPLANTAARAKKVISMAREKNVGLWLSSQRRWEPCHLQIRQKLSEGMIGNIIHVNGYYVKGITHIGCTLINTMRFLCGDIDWAMAFPPFDAGSYGADPSMRGIMGFKSGATASITGCDADEYVYSIFELDIMGTNGRIRIEENGDVIYVYEAREYDNYQGFKELKLIQKIETEMKWSMKYGLGMLMKDMSEGKRSAFFAEEGLADMLIVEALKHSAASGGTRVGA